MGIADPNTLEDLAQQTEVYHDLEPISKGHFSKLTTRRPFQAVAELATAILECPELYHPVGVARKRLDQLRELQIIGLNATRLPLRTTLAVDTIDDEVAVPYTVSDEFDRFRDVIRLGVSATADEVVSARQALAANVSQMREALAELGFTTDQLSTEQYTIYEEPRTSSKQQQDQDEHRIYEAVQAFEIATLDTESTGKIIDTAIENGATRIDGVQFTLSKETRQHLRKTALTEAMTNTRGQAEALAESADLAIGEVKLVRTGGTSNHPYDPDVIDTTELSGESTSVDASSVAVTARVEVVYTVGDE